MQYTFFQGAAGKRTKKQKFFDEIETYLPISKWIEMIIPYYRNGKIETKLFQLCPLNIKQKRCIENS